MQKFSFKNLSDNEKQRLIKFFEILIEIDKKQKKIKHVRYNKVKHKSSTNS